MLGDYLVLALRDGQPTILVFENLAERASIDAPLSSDVFRPSVRVVDVVLADLLPLSVQEAPLGLDCGELRLGSMREVRKGSWHADRAVRYRRPSVILHACARGDGRDCGDNARRWRC